MFPYPGLQKIHGRLNIQDTSNLNLRKEKHNYTTIKSEILRVLLKFLDTTLIFLKLYCLYNNLFLRFQ